MTQSLDEYAKTHQVKTIKCTTCKLPDDIRKQIRDARAKGVDYNVISDWLRTLGYGIAACSISRHERGLCGQKQNPYTG